MTGAEAHVLTRAVAVVVGVPVVVVLFRRMQRKEAADAEAAGASYGCRATVPVRALRDAGLLVSRHPRLSVSLSFVFGATLAYGRLRLTPDALVFLVPDEGRRVGIGNVTLPWTDVASVRVEDERTRSLGSPGMSLSYGSLRVRLRSGRSVVFEGVPGDVSSALRDVAAPVEDLQGAVPDRRCR